MNTVKIKKTKKQTKYTISEWANHLLHWAAAPHPGFKINHEWMWDVVMHCLLPCWEWVCGGLCCGTAAGLLCAGGGVWPGRRRGGRTHAVLTCRGATVAAVGSVSAARWWGRRRCVTGQATSTVLQPVWRQLNFVWEEKWKRWGQTKVSGSTDVVMWIFQHN